MKVYLIRHGKSEDAERGISQRKEAGLSESSKWVIQKLKPDFEKIPFTKVYYSPWNRAKETAKILFDHTSIPLEEVSYIHEYRKPSHLEGTHQSITNDFWDKNQHNIYKPDWRPGDGESFNDILERIKKLRELLMTHDSNDLIGVVAHGIVFRHLVGYWLMDEEYSPFIFSRLLRHIPLNNLGYIIVDINKKQNKIHIREWHNSRETTTHE